MNNQHIENKLKKIYLGAIVNECAVDMTKLGQCRDNIYDLFFAIKYSLKIDLTKLPFRNKINIKNKININKLDNNKFDNKIKKYLENGNIFYNELNQIFEKKYENKILSSFITPMLRNISRKTGTEIRKFVITPMLKSPKLLNSLKSPNRRSLNSLNSLRNSPKSLNPLNSLRNSPKSLKSPNRRSLNSPNSLNSLSRRTPNRRSERVLGG